MTENHDPTVIEGATPEAGQNEQVGGCPVVHGLAAPDDGGRQLSSGGRTGST